MALKTLILECDYCSDSPVTYEAEEHESRQDLENEARMYGWWFVKGPNVILGDDEKVYCCFDCMSSDLL